MAYLTLAQIQALAASVGFPDPALAAAVAMAESAGNPNAYNTEGSYGLWQIDIVYNTQYASNPSVLFDPVTNAKAAYAISSKGTNFKPWTTYRCPCNITPCVGTPCYKQWYQPQTNPPAPSTTRYADLALAATAAVSLAGLGYLAWREYREPGYVLPFRAGVTG
jgi:Lysozyme like domain